MKNTAINELSAIMWIHLKVFNSNFKELSRLINKHDF